MRICPRCSDAITEECAKVCVDKGIVPTLLELLTVEEPRLNYQAVCVCGLLASFASEYQELIRKGGLDSIAALLKQSPGGSAARFIVLEAIFKIISGNRTLSDLFGIAL